MTQGHFFRVPVSFFNKVEKQQILVIKINMAVIKMNYVYILRCSDESLYTGWTNNIEKRLKAHETGKGGKYTRGRLPVELVYLEEYEDKITAQKRECEIKKMERAAKLELINMGC